jgi:hypothetical protein
MAQHLNGFAAYPSNLREVTDTMGRLRDEVDRRKLQLTVDLWKNNDIVGYCLIDPIRAKIDSSTFLLADITRLNFNVVYEIGFAIGKKRRVILVKNKSIKKNLELERELGLFDTLGYKEYQNAGDLATFLGSISTVRPLAIPDKKRSDTVPFFIVWPQERTEAEVRLNSRIKKQLRASFRQFDPTEGPRLSLSEAVNSVANANGIILPLISSNRRDSEVHNLRCAFVAGLADGLERETLILQSGGEPVPLDYRDAVAFYSHLEDIDGHLADFAPRVWERSLRVAQAEFPELKTPIQKLNLGHSAAENEHDQLANYYIETEQFDSVLRGEAQVVTGRKGSGKTALFYQIRNKTRSNRQNIVLDLNPDGFQLRKFKTLVLDHLEDGTREHTITAFWEYLFFLEICYKLLEKDRKTHLNNHVLRPKYIALQKLYQNDNFVAEGDFAERLLLLIEAIEDKFSIKEASFSSAKVMSREEITGFLYQHSIDKLRDSITDYLAEKRELWILFDNIDKGWSAHGVDQSDLLNLRCLIEALRKLQRQFKRSALKCRTVVFVRNDVYELLIDSMPDRGKVSRASLDWTDPSLLEEMLRRRFVYSLGIPISSAPNFSTLWSSFAISHLPNGEETFRYIIHRSLMRPRSLLDFLHQCKSHAVNLGHEKIDISDVFEGELNYSTDLVNGISLEIQDVLPSITDALFAFIESSPDLTPIALESRLNRLTKDAQNQERLLNLLFWYGFLGFTRGDLTECYIYTVSYDMKKFRALLENLAVDDRIYIINPAFYKGLEIVDGLGPK